MDGTILGQGTFVVPAAVVSQNIMIPSNVDWMRVINLTKWGTVGGAAAYGLRYYWQRGFPTGSGIVEYYANGGAAIHGDQLDSGAFNIYDPSTFANGAAVALTAITAANPPVVTTASTSGISVGSIVRLMNLDNQPQISGIDFTVTAVTANTNFTLGNINITNSTASTTGSWRLIPFDSLYYPRHRVITYISSTNSAKIYMSVTHGLTVGQEIRLSFPGSQNFPSNNSYQWGAFGALDGVTAIITSVNDARAGNEPNNGGVANSITVNINTSGFPAWNTFGNLPNNNGSNQGFPPAAAVPFSPALVVPFGEDSATSLSSVAAQTPLGYNGLQIANTQTGLLADATVNTGFLGMTLGTGALGVISGAAITGPAGSQAGDVMYWVSGKSTFGGL